MKWLQKHRYLRSFGQDAEAAGQLWPRPVGARQVPLQKIVGSVGRASELRDDFMPAANPTGDQRFTRIRELLQHGAALPPVELYQLGDRYYVLDGHHRVAAARRLGHIDMDAMVTEMRRLSGVRPTAAA